MRFRYLSITLLFVLFSLCLNSQNNKRKITIKATNTFIYCQGDEPDPAELKRLATPVPMRGAMLFVRRGSLNDVNSKVEAAGKTDTSGNVVFTLDTGTYVIVGKDKVDSKIHDNIIKKYKYKTELAGPANKECLARWLETPLLVIYVTDNGPLNFSFNLVADCPSKIPPCVNYIGPTPP